MRDHDHDRAHWQWFDALPSTAQQHLIDKDNLLVRARELLQTLRDTAPAEHHADIDTWLTEADDTL